MILVPIDKIRVGRDYQAVCPELQPEAMRKPELLADRALLVWSPTVNISEKKRKLAKNRSIFTIVHTYLLKVFEK